MQVPVKRACGVWAALLIGLVAITASAVTSPSALAQSTLSPEAKTALQEGIAAAKFQNWDGAQKHFEAALAAAPGAPEVLFNLGLLYDRKGGAELVASAWYRAYPAAAPKAQNRAEVEARLIDLHASAEARAAKYMATAKEVAKQLVPTVSTKTYDLRGFTNLLDGEIIAGRLESVDEIIGWFQNNEDQNYFLFDVACSLVSMGSTPVMMFVEERPARLPQYLLDLSQEAPRYIEKISGPQKVKALRRLATAKWLGGDKTSAIRLVNEADTVATQLLKGFEESSVPDDKYNILELRSNMVVAWSAVGNTAKARRSLESIDPNLVEPESPLSRYLLVEAFGSVAITLLLTGKEKEAKVLLRAIVYKIRNGWTRKEVQRDLEEKLDDLKIKSHEDLIWIGSGRQDLRIGLGYLGWRNGFFWLWRFPYAAQTAQDQWRSVMSKWREFPGLSREVVYSDDKKFLATASGLDAEATVKLLSEGAADLVLGSRVMKEIAEAWQKEGAEPAQ